MARFICELTSPIEGFKYLSLNDEMLINSHSGSELHDALFHKQGFFEHHFDDGLVNVVSRDNYNQYKDILCGAERKTVNVSVSDAGVTVCYSGQVVAQINSMLIGVASAKAIICVSKDGEQYVSDDYCSSFPLAG